MPFHGDGSWVTWHNMKIGVMSDISVFGNMSTTEVEPKHINYLPDK